MKFMPWMTRRLMAAAIAMTVLFALLVVATVRLLSSENTQSDYISEDMVWLSSQAQYEAIRFADVLNEVLLGRLSIAEAQLPLDLLSSRIVVLEGGETYRQIGHLGHAKDLASFRKIVDDATRDLAVLTTGDVDEINRLHKVAIELAKGFRTVANHAMFGKRQTDTEIRERRRQILFQVIGTLLGTMIAGLLVGGILVRDHRNMVGAESALDRERQVSKLHRAFISIVSHQFRTPLAIIDASAQRMARRGQTMDSEEISLRTAKIRAACLRLTRLMESTLNAARLEDGEISLKIRPCDPTALLKGVIESQPEQDKIRLSLRLKGMPGRIEADLTLFEQAVMNLVSNALKYSGSDEMVIIEAGQRGNELEISVIDRGVGVPADEVDQLFRRFFRARTAQGLPGTGIGLNFAAQIVALHHGRTEVRSVEGQGSTFTIHLPLRQPEASTTSVAARRQPTVIVS